MGKKHLSNNNKHINIYHNPLNKKQRDKKKLLKMRATDVEEDGERRSGRRQGFSSSKTNKEYVRYDISYHMVAIKATLCIFLCVCTFSFF